MLEEIHKRLVKIQLMSTCIHNSVTTTKQFYKYFICFQLIVTVFIITHNTLMVVARISYFYISNITLCLVELELVPIMLCTAMWCEFEKIISLLGNCYY